MTTQALYMGYCHHTPTRCISSAWRLQLNASQINHARESSNNENCRCGEVSLQSENMPHASQLPQQDAHLMFYVDSTFEEKTTTLNGLQDIQFNRHCTCTSRTYNSCSAKCVFDLLNDFFNT